VITVAVDAMGGDNAPQAVVAAARAFAREERDARVLLVGQPERLGDAGVEVVPASEVIAADEAPAAAIRRKRDSSVAVGLGLVRSGDAQAFVSAGNTGALMAGSLLVLGRIPGVDRPAMSSVLPTIDGRGFLLLDLGAQMDATPRNLYEYAVMGSLYAELVRGIARPRVGLLNVGTEEGKGNEVSRQAYALLAQSGLNFVGNVESRDVFASVADVVVSDGFVGNVLLKAIEGYGVGVVRVLGHELRHSGFQTLLGAFLARHTLWRLKRRLDWTEYNGAPFLGVGGSCIKCHGSSDARAMLNGIRLAATFARQDVVGRIGAALAGKGGDTDG
jgi:glycerol-3-phosphate acyltransferase PlsX